VKANAGLIIRVSIKLGSTQLLILSGTGKSRLVACTARVFCVAKLMRWYVC